jgi:hypothetical protein
MSHLYLIPVHQGQDDTDRHVHWSHRRETESCSVSRRRPELNDHIMGPGIRTMGPVLTSSSLLWRSQEPGGRAAV